MNELNVFLMVSGANMDDQGFQGVVDASIVLITRPIRATTVQYKIGN